MRKLTLIYLLLSLITLVYSYVFVDPNLTLSINPWYQIIQSKLSVFLYQQRQISAVFYLLLIFFWFGLYAATLRLLTSAKANHIRVFRLILLAAIVLLLAFPAFSYDIFNYILTAKVAFFWKENPYIVMPIEIPNDSALVYTRAANKVALYGPTWILLSWLPHALGMGKIWLTIVMFKVLVGTFYLFLTWFIYRLTKSAWQVAFFALNPLVVNEILVSGHNDIVMMVLALVGMVWVGSQGLKNKIAGLVMWILSVLVKGSTLLLAPLFFSRWSFEKKVRVAFFVMLGVFLLTPLREELYPWYAVWFLTFAALIPRLKRQLVHGFTIALTLGLELRHLPYILTREYGGNGPLWRIILTVTPVTLWFLWQVFIQPRVAKRKI